MMSTPGFSSLEPVKTAGGGGGQLTGPSISYYELLAPKKILSSDNDQIFAEFWVWVSSGARRSVSVGNWGARQLSFLGGGVKPEGCIIPTPPPPVESPSTPGHSRLIRTSRGNGSQKFRAAHILQERH